MYFQLVLKCLLFRGILNGFLFRFASGQTVRLVGGGSDLEGRVEVYHKGKWGTVCDDGFGALDAKVFCFLLGYERNGAMPVSDLYGGGNGPIWLDDLDCKGTESTIDECGKNNGVWGFHNCGHSEDVGIICQPKVRLAGGSTEYEGRIEVQYSSNWGTVCDEGFGILEAQVFCHVLGFNRLGAQAYRNSYFGKGTGQVIVKSINCSGNETSLNDCNDHEWESKSNCPGNAVAGIKCISKLDIRLIGGSTVYEGRVEMYHSSNWGTICYNDLSNSDAQVLCHMLGYPREGAIAFNNAYFGQGTGHIVLDYLDCDGQESSVLACRNTSFEHSNCSHEHDVGIRCQPNVRLVDGDSVYEGRVEVYHSEEWGTVCDDLFDANEAQVLCYMMGYERNGIVLPSNSFHLGIGTILLDDLECTGIETSINDCGYKEDTWGIHDCSHDEDAGVTCQPKSRCPGLATPRNGSYSNSSCLSDSLVGQYCTLQCDSGFNSNFLKTVCLGTGIWNVSDAFLTCTDVNECSTGVHTCSQNCRNTPGTYECYCESGYYLESDNKTCAECPDNKYYCAQSVTCISEQWHCDYEYDCDYGEDEANCDYKINQFDMTRNRGLKIDHRKETYIGSSNETCAKLCLSRMSYVCRSFAFSPNDRSCELSDVSTENVMAPFTWKYKSFVYELISQRESTETVEVRLVGEEEQAGRVEVKYLGEWGVICDDQWDNIDAAVICNMLGYKGSRAVATTHSKYGIGNGNFLLDEVNCLGIEDSISKCKHDGWKVHDCRSHEVAGVECRAQKACASNQYSCSNGMCLEASQVCDGICQCTPQCEDENGNGETDCKSAALEIVDGPEKGAGRVEIVRNGLRGTVCDDSWDNNDAVVVCRMAGFRYGEAVSGGTYGEGTGAIWLDDVKCTGREMSLTNCRTSNWGVSDCSHMEDVGVVCSNTPPIQIFLEDGSTEGEGRVEIIANGERGTVCDDSWDDNDATVVCRMLGYSFGSARVEAYYGPGSDSLRVTLDDVECDGTESSLLACSHAGWGTSNCAHGEDAGVKCFSGEDEEGQIDTGFDDVLSGVACGLRPLEIRSRKKREEPGGPGERELESPPKFERIIGGFTAAKGFYPWQVGVRRLVSLGEYSHWCGGTILSDHWILSAAHCFTDLNKGHIVVRTGDHDNKVLDDFEQEFELEHLINHRLYDENSYDFDIALLKVKLKDGSGIKFSDHVQPACLPEQTTQYVEGQNCHVSGWGKTEHGYQNMLKSARVPIISDKKCKRLYKDITDNMVCAGFLAGGIDSCAGDSGGPLVCDINGRYTVMGATSWGAGCAEANAPGVYTRVTEFISWIKSTIKENS